MTSPVNSEPAVRDPIKLRRTALILVGVILIGGWLVLKAYETWAARQSADDRPSIVHRILKERDLRVIRQDGKTADLFDLRGHVFAINVVSIEHPESSERGLGVMKRLAAKYSGNSEFNLVTLAIDSVPAEKVVASLARAADTNGIKLPQWWLGSNESATLGKFIRSELKPGVPPEMVDGKWVFDSSIVLVDRNGHLRRAVIPRKNGSGPPAIISFDFDQAAQWDAEGRKSGSDRSNIDEMESLLHQTIDKLFAEPFQP